MAIPHQALVLVTDGRKLLFLRNHGDENQIDLRTEAHDEREDRKDHEIKTDAAGSPPKALGVLRKELHKEVERRVVATFNKEMTDRPIPDIEDLLVGEAAPPA